MQQSTQSRTRLSSLFASHSKDGSGVLLIRVGEGIRTLAIRVLQNQGYKVSEQVEGEQTMLLCERHATPAPLAGHASQETVSSPDNPLAGCARGSGAEVLRLGR